MLTDSSLSLPVCGVCVGGRAHVYWHRVSWDWRDCEGPSPGPATSVASPSRSLGLNLHIRIITPFTLTQWMVDKLYFQKQFSIVRINVIHNYHFVRHYIVPLDISIAYKLCYFSIFSYYIWPLSELPWLVIPFRLDQLDHRLHDVEVMVCMLLSSETFYGQQKAMSRKFWLIYVNSSE